MKTLLKLLATLTVAFSGWMVLNASADLLNVRSDVALFAGILLPLAWLWWAVQFVKMIWRKKKCENI